MTAVLYTAVMGGYEALREEPLAHESDLDFVCFTDDPGLTSKTWRIVVVEPWLATDSIRSARRLKICGHRELDGHDRSLWIDNTVELLVPPEEILDTWLVDADVALPLHSFRASVLGEAEAVLDSGKDDYVRVYEQLSHYTRTAPAALDLNPHWTGMVARRRTSQVEAVMRTWWEHVLRFSRRDQLSFSVVMAGSGLRLRSVPLPNLESPLHRWPTALGRSVRPDDSLREALRPPLARIGALEEERDRSISRANQLQAHAEAVEADRDGMRAEVEQLRQQAVESEERIRSLEGSVAHLRDRMQTLRERVRRLRARLHGE